MNRTYAKGDIIFCFGEKADSMFEIFAGSVGIYANYGESDERLLTVLEEGSVFGEMGMIDAMPRSATAVAMEELTRMKVITVGDFVTYFRESPEKVLGVMQNMSGRIRDLTADYLDACRAVTESEEAAQTGRKSSWLKANAKRFMTDYSDAVAYMNRHPDMFAESNSFRNFYMF